MKLNTKRTCLVGLAFLSISAFWGLYDFVIPLVLKNTYGLGGYLGRRGDGHGQRTGAIFAALLRRAVG